MAVSRHIVAATAAQVTTTSFRTIQLSRVPMPVPTKLPTPEPIRMPPSANAACQAVPVVSMWNARKERDEPGEEPQQRLGLQ